MMMETQIANAQLTMQSLQLRRKILEVRLQRKLAKEEHEMHVQQCQERTSIASKRFNALIHGQSDMSDYVDAVMSNYSRNPGRYFVRRHAKLIKITRSQSLLEGYVEMAREQNAFLIGSLLEEAKQDILMELQERKEEKQARAYQIHEQMVKLVTVKIQTYYDNKTRKKNQQRTRFVGGMRQSAHHQGTLIQRLVSRKASNRLCMV